MEKTYGKIGISRFRTAIMGFSALWIWCFHCCSGFVFDQPGWPREIEFFLKRIGFCGVDIFLLLSAFGLYYSFEKNAVTDIKSYVNYIKKRFIRVYEVYLPATVLIGAISGWSLAKILLKLSTYTAWAENFYDFLWFVPAILVLYLFAPFWYRLLKRVSNVTNVSVLTYAAVLLWLVILYGLQGALAYRPDLSAVLNRVPIFLVGFWFGHMEYHEKWNRLAAVLSGCGLLLVGFPFSYLVNNGRVPILFEAENALVNVLIAPGLVIILCMLLTGIASCKIGSWIDKLLAFWGTMSLEFYCLQEFVNKKARIVIGQDAVKRDVLALVCCTVAAYLLHLFIVGCKKYLKRRSILK